MLLELQIKNFAIIEEQEISFLRGLNVITGETGAGKSIIIQSLELLLGAKLKQEYMRDGADEMTITAIFELNDHLKKELPEEIAETIKDSAELLISRVCQRNGRSKAYINGSIVTVAILESVAQKFLNLCSQAAFVRLLDPKYHLSYLDLYAKNSDIQLQYLEKYKEVQSLKSKLKTITEDSAKMAVQKLWFQQIVDDLQDLELTPTLKEEISLKIASLSQFEKLQSVVSDLKAVLYETGGVDSVFRAITSKLNLAKKIDPKFETEVEDLQKIWGDYSDLQLRIEKRLNNSNFDEDEIEKLRSLLSEIAKFERKYKTDCSGLYKMYLEAKTKLPELDDSAPALEKLKAEIQKLDTEVVKLGKKLSESRKTANQKLSKEVQKELSELSMKSANLEFAFKECEPSATGIDAGEFIFSANKGEGLKPLRSIASGGELSRLTLVLKKLIKDQSGTSVLVFDEVDTGVSGSVARAVGKKLKELSVDSQVICITHIPQVASLADQHLYVAKKTKENTKDKSKSRTSSMIEVLRDNDRIEEIARMLAGDKVTDTARKAAIELLEV